MFIHWGIYALDGWHEQQVYRQSLPPADYEPLVDRFNPEAFDPDQWLDLCEEVGMEYLCITTKHIDGFCMWDSALTDYKITSTPYRRDVLAMLAEACERRSFPLCLYYSLIDNHHPCYPHSGRAYEKPRPESGHTADLGRYLDYVRGQVEELCTRYGRISAFWWDTGRILEHTDPSINDRIRSLQPGILINDRGLSPGDFDTPERDSYGYVHQQEAFSSLTEACQSVGVESWGYRRDEDYYALRYLEESIAGIMARGGNYLLNVAPTEAGTIPSQARELLSELGRWYTATREAFCGTRYATPSVDVDTALSAGDVEMTLRGSHVYVIFGRHPKCTRLLLKPMTSLPRRGVLLNSGEEVATRVERIPSTWKDPVGYLQLRELPLNSMSNTVMVVRLDFDEPPISVAKPAGTSEAGQSEQIVEQQKEAP